MKKLKELFAPVDLTKGNIITTFLKFLIPIVLSQLFQQVYTLTDSIIVGQTLSQNAVAGVNDSSTMVSIVLWFALGCTSGFSIVISREVGLNDKEALRRNFTLQIFLSILISVILTVIAIFLINPMLSMLKIHPSSTDSNMQEIYEAAYHYVFIIYLGIIAQMFYNLIVAVLRALGDSFTPFLFLLFSTVLNIGLDLLFIITFHMGVDGSAWATILSQGIAAIGAFIYGYIRYPELRMHKSDWKFRKHDVTDNLKLGIPLGFQYSILFIGVIVMQAAIVSFDLTPEGIVVDGNPAQVGFGVANKLNTILQTLYNSIGTGFLSFVSQNYGAGNRERLKKGYKVCILFGLISYALNLILTFTLTINGAYQYLFLSADKINAATIRYGNLFLYCDGVFGIVLFFLYVGRCGMQGLEKPLYPLLAGVGELVARFLFCLILPPLFNNGPINSSASDWIYICVCLGDAFAWICSTVITFPKLTKIIFSKKDSKEASYNSENPK